MNRRKKNRIQANITEGVFNKVTIKIFSIHQMNQWFWIKKTETHCSNKTAKGDYF